MTVTHTHTCSGSRFGRCSYIEFPTDAKLTHTHTFLLPCFVCRHVTEQMIPHMTTCSTALEMAGAALLQRRPLSVFGQSLIDAGQEIMSLSALLRTISSSEENSNAVTIAIEAAQRCQYAATQMILAGTTLCPNASPTSEKEF